MSRQWFLSVTREKAKERDLFFVFINGDELAKVLRPADAFALMNQDELYDYYQTLLALAADAEKVISWHKKNAVNTQ